MAKKKSPKQDQGHPLEKIPITQGNLDKIASLPPEQFQREIVQQVHELYLQMLEIINWTADQRDMAGKTFAKGLKTVARGADDRLKMLEDWAFTITILINNMRGLPPDVERNRGIAEMFNIDFDATLKEMEAGA